MKTSLWLPQPEKWILILLKYNVKWPLEKNNYTLEGVISQLTWRVIYNCLNIFIWFTVIGHIWPCYNFHWSVHNVFLLLKNMLTCCKLNKCLFRLLSLYIELRCLLLSANLIQSIKNKMFLLQCASFLLLYKIQTDI